MRKILDWILWSSENPDKISRTLKWGASAILTFAAWYGLDQNVLGPMLSQSTGDVTSLLSAVAAFVEAATKLVTYAMTAYYGLAKIFNTFRNKQ